MTRTQGSRDTQYEERRAALLNNIILRLSKTNDTKPSLRQIAKDAGVTVPTLLHYFGDRDAVIVAALEHWHSQGRVYLEAASVPNGTFEQSIKHYAENLLVGLTQFGIADFLAAGFVEAILDDRKGPAFVNHALEPIIMAFANLLTAHQKNCEMRDVDSRFAAIAFISPILVLCHHQYQLFGAKTHPTDLRKYVDQHVETFIRSHKT